MPEPVIQVRGLGKMYRLGATLSHDTLRDHITAAAKGLWKRIKADDSPQRRKDAKVDSDSRPSSPSPLASPARSACDGAAGPDAAGGSSLRGDTDPSIFWALKDVSFDVHEGEVVGIIGRNGAGKSTLLKILSQITEPTEGEVRIHGRIASLLEVGTGFHPELSGRENIYLNGAILGMTRREIQSKFDEIVAFAEVDRFIDTPVKRYSSGMYVRLAFAVAAHLEPEILLVDEVLAVGDVQFQKKCLGKMGEVAKGGRTVLFVSHNMGAVRSLCSRALLLECGRVESQGTTDSVVDAYLSTASTECLAQEWGTPAEAPGNGKARLKRVALEYPGKSEGEPLTTHVPVDVHFEFWNLGLDGLLNISTHLRNVAGEVLFNVWSHQQEMPACALSGVLRIPGDFLNDGLYTLDFMVVENSRRVYCLDPALTFQVHDWREGIAWFGKVSGAIRPVFLSFPLEAAQDA